MEDRYIFLLLMETEEAIPIQRLEARTNQGLLSIQGMKMGQARILDGLQPMNSVIALE